MSKTLAGSFISRPRIEELIRESVRTTPLTIVRAPLGSGKTVAITAALANRADVARFDVHPWHNGNAFEPLVTAVRSIRADFGRRTLAALDAGATPEILAQLFAGDLRNVAGSLVIVVDNTEHLADDEHFATFVDSILASLAEDVRFVFSGRALPSISLSTALVRKKATLIESDALAFTPQETITLAKTTTPDVSAAHIAGIVRDSDGWATGVALALAAPAGSSKPEGGDLARAFLTEALLPRLTPETLAFLEETAVYQTLDAALLQDESAAGFDAAVAALERAGAPIVRTGARAYRVHALLRSLALERLSARGGADAAHSRAAAAFARTGNLAAALFHARASLDEPTVDALLRAHADSLVRTGNAVPLRDALQLLRRPESEDIRAYVEALLAKVAGDERAADHFERAREAADRNGNERISFASRAQNIERGLALLRPVDERELADLETRGASLDLSAQAQTAMYRGWQRAVEHDFAGSLRAVEPLRGAGDAAARFNTGVLFAYAQIAQGEIDRGLAEMDALVRLFEDDDRIVLQTLALIWQARFALLAGRTTLASDAGRAALRLVESLSIRAEEAALYGALAELATHEGDVNAAVRFAERASNAASHAWYAADVARSRAFADVVLARAAFLGHDNTVAFDLALRAARSVTVPVQRAVAYAEAVAYASLIDVERAERLLAEAHEAIAVAKPIDAADVVMLATAADILAFIAAAAPHALAPMPPLSPPFAHLVEQRRGLVTLEHAGIALANLRAGKGTATPFDLALERIAAEGPRFEVRIARAIAAPLARAPREVAAPLPSFELTPRESEILALLVGGLSNKEIAQRLVLSPRTAETHVERVLGKLGVPSRSRAIAKALRLGLVTLPEE